MKPVPSLTPLSLALLSAVFSASPAMAQSVPAGESSLREVTVTGTREGELLAETPASIGIIKDKAIRDVRPTHPSEIMGQVSGVWINVTGGEGHQAAIRQPLTTSPVYLYLEDGIPTRSTGFFNHNALYEINLPQSGGVEVNKGPGSALYGSDAIGGVINVLTRKPPVKGEIEASAEAGSFGWLRTLVGGGTSFGDNAIRADLNLTHTDGWRDKTGYDRQAGTLRWDRAIGGDAVLKTVMSFSEVDQQTAGSSAIVEDDYRNSPRKNYTPISFRKVSAFRLSAAYEKESADSLLSITPYYRNNDMDLLANWALSYDPTVYNTRNQSFGVLLKYRQDFVPLRTRLIVGADVDYSPGSRSEDSIFTTNVGAGATRNYVAYRNLGRIYDYDVAYRGISPYVHGEISPTDRLRVTAGLRYDNMQYNYDNKMTDDAVTMATSVGNKVYGHVGDTKRSYGHFSPKLGATYAFSDSLSGFASYNHAFRAPSEGQLFRPGQETTAIRAQIAAQAALDLKPVKVDSYETGLRGKIGNGINYDAAIYHMTKQDDIVSYTDPVTSARTVLNAGKTQHRGIEMGIGAELSSLWRIDGAYSYARHTYKTWVVANTADYSGKEMEVAPRSIGNVRLSFGNTARGLLQLEWVHLGSWWSDQANTIKYGGHDVFNLRGSLPVARDVRLFANVHNLFDKRYAESTGVSNNLGTFSPGLPLSVVAGVEAKW